MNGCAGGFAAAPQSGAFQNCKGNFEIAHSIMDEPTVGIDPQSRNRIMENVKELNRQGAAIIYTTHYIPEVEDICSKITIIDHGSIVADGTKDEIMHKAGMNGASMEQIFLQLTGTDLRD